MTNLKKLWRATSSLTTGDVHRHTISLSPLLDPALFPSTNRLFLKVTNTTSPLYNAVPLAGPYQFTASCMDEHSQATMPKFFSRIMCGNSWKIELSTSQAEHERNGPTAQQANADQPDVAGKWRIELVSEVVFSKVNVSYEVELSLETAEHILGAPLDEDTTALSNSDSVISSTIFSPSISHLKTTTTSDIFRPPPLPTTSLSPSKHHFVVLTHGLHGTQADFLYLREAIENQYAAGEEGSTDRVLVWTCDVNHTLTEHGIKVAGLRIAERLMAYLGWPWADAAPITHISFIGHSFGGLLNLFILGHLQRVSDGQFFLQIRPVNFITLATPWCGSFELPWIAKQALALGMLGQTGKDLVLCQHRNDGIREELAMDDEPILLAMAHPDSYAHRALRMFGQRTVYANTEWDPTVGFRTSILWYCGMEGAGESGEVTRAGSKVNVDKTVDGVPPSCLTNPLIHPPPTSLFSQLRNILRPNPIPDQWLLDPSAIPNPIIHDRVYVPTDDVPATKWKSKCRNEIEEEIARLWHSDMAFRKVCVRLHSPAHEGIVVRRRWVNGGGGWNVLAHLMREHAF